MNTLRLSGLLWTLSLVLSRFGFRVLRLWPDRMISPGDLERQVVEVLRSWGMSEEHIAISTKHIMYADLHGIDSHGCSMLLHYHRQLKVDSVTITPKIEIVRDNETTAVIDGGGGLGHVPADMAMKLAIAKCLDTGVGIVAVRNSGHFGAAGAYALMASQSGLIGMALTNVKTPALVPTNGLKACLGTNPISFSAPASNKRPFLLDMATSIVPMGKVVTARRRGRLIPRGWAQDKTGKALRNPDKAIAQRRLTSLGSTPELGSHKGYGLASMVEILSSVLPGNTKTNGVGHFFLALDPAQFGESAEFKADLAEMMDSLRSSPSITPDQPVQVAGDPEYSAAEHHQKNGIPLTRSVLEDIRMVCQESGATFSLDSGVKIPTA